ncbi:oxidoreductase domain protein [Spirosoma linguale DSM 74]|uniref:Oxidoreductase domain protein n=1 Tax=Spirosoma linguale (strain ATCC 33905 / DSM 74 / LMG 10896 / Claus 1) TaxID=504472 RepID=D2QJL3_SPILD|nr:oxidoreductase domain protein [Spirosoma linguale DSM 74]
MARYIRLYGLSRTIAKVRAHYHMNRVYSQTSSLPVPAGPTRKHVGILGCGKFAYANVAYYVRRHFGAVIRGVMDTDLNKAISLAQRYQADYYTTNADDVLNDPHIDLIYIVSNHASHAEYAIAAIRKGKAVHIEKPHVVNADQLIRLCAAINEHNGRVRLGFNRPESPLGLLLKQQMDAQAGPAMINWFVAGHAITPGHWYFAEEEGGRILGNLCHWIDFTLRLIPVASRYPVQIIPTRAQRSDCDISVSYLFGDGSIATITFSAKGHTFEGVRETLNVHKGNLLAQLTDFQRLRLDIGPVVCHRRLWFRDHGHRRSILDSYLMRGDKSKHETVAMIRETGWLMLKTREALETTTVITVTANFSR